MIPGSARGSFGTPPLEEDQGTAAPERAELRFCCAVVVVVIPEVRFAIRGGTAR